MGFSNGCTLHTTTDDSVYAHDWQVGDLVVFDTLGTMHRRDEWDPTQRRLMRQLSTACTVEPAAMATD